MKSSKGGSLKGVALALASIVGVVVGVVVGAFVPQVHQAYVTETETGTLHTTEIISHTLHTTETLFTTKTGMRIETITETEALTYTQRTTATQKLTTTIITTITPTETIPPGYEVYSKYGFSFQYPRDMTISELGLLETIATNHSGMVVGELTNDRYEAILTGWIETDVAAGEYDLDTALERGFQGMEQTGGWTNLERGEMVETTKARHPMIYQHFNITIVGEAFYGIIGVWLCDTSQRLYQLHLIYSEEDPLPTYQRYLDSFVCLE